MPALVCPACGGSAVWILAPCPVRISCAELKLNRGGPQNIVQQGMPDTLSSLQWADSGRPGPALTAFCYWMLCAGRALPHIRSA